LKSITVGKFPLPPSSNHQYMPLVMHGKLGGKNVGKPVARLVPTPSLKAFKFAMINWHMQRKRLADQSRLFVLECFARKNFVRLDTYWCIPKGELFYQNGNPKKSDLFNRLKALHDSFCEIAGFDDSRIKAGYAEQMGIEGNEAFSFIVLTEHRFRMISEYKFGEIPK
jgi:hypothetical protein